LIVIIQARSNSKRFNNKVLYKIYNKPIIWHVVSKIKKSKNVKKIIIATSKNKTDDKLIKYLTKIKINYYRGSLTNVAKRLCDAAEKNKAKFFMRISADSPLIDPVIIDKAIKIFNSQKKKYDIITNVFPRSYPKGQSVEIIKTSKLRYFLSKFNKEQKEHVTKYFYKNYKNFMIKNFMSVENKAKIKLAIDTKNDLKLILKKFKEKKFINFSLK
jgi:spore coat polysaccharide biosynthesis protein SpsF (cytidylyltransferase family)